jgi:hypothetical protein
MITKRTFPAMSKVPNLVYKYPKKSQVVRQILIIVSFSMTILFKYALRGK